MYVPCVLDYLVRRQQPSRSKEKGIDLIAARRSVCPDLIVERNNLLPVEGTEQHAVTGVWLQQQRLDCTELMGLGTVRLEWIPS